MKSCKCVLCLCNILSVSQSNEMSKQQQLEWRRQSLQNRKELKRNMEELLKTLKEQNAQKEQENATLRQELKNAEKFISTKQKQLEEVIYFLLKN